MTNPYIVTMDLREAISRKEKELKALCDLCECLEYEKGFPLNKGIPQGEQLQALIANKMRQVEALCVLTGQDPVQGTGSTEVTLQLKEADFGNNLEKTVVQPLEQAEVIAKDSDPGHIAYWKELVKKAWGSMVSLRNGAPPAASGAANYEAALQNVAHRLQNDSGANPREMNELRMFLHDFPSLYKTDNSLMEFGKKTFAQKDPNKIPQAKKALELFTNIIDMAGKIDRWKGSNFLDFVKTLVGYTNGFRNAYNSLAY